MDRRSRLLTEMALTLALSATLGRLPVIQMPFGGSVSLDMVPLFLFALRNGAGPGLLAGAAYGGIDYLMKPYFVHWAQLLLDYPLAFAACGLAGVSGDLARRVGGGLATRLGLPLALSGVVLGSGVRFLAHFASGVVFFGSYAPEGQSVWAYSALYNGAYMVPSAAAAVVVLALLVPALERVVPARRGLHT